jgi:hypothetical protein
MAVTEPAGLTVEDLATAILGRPADTTEAANLTRVLATADALVENYARAAPPAIKREAVTRCAAYLYRIQPGAPRQLSTGAVQQSLWIPRGSSPLRSSGATALLTPWKRRRAL